eukprot:581426-Hanusia_phi.AAC.1
MILRRNFKTETVTQVPWPRRPYAGIPRRIPRRRRAGPAGPARAPDHRDRTGPARSHRHRTDS